jgi:hypothetical protein
MRLVLVLTVLALAACSNDANRTDIASPVPDSMTIDARLDVRKTDRARDAKPRDGRVDGRAADAATLTCFELSLDPNVPLAIDGVFDAKTPLWRRPNDDPPVCPAKTLLPATTMVPHVAYAFCNKDTKAHTFTFEMVSEVGPKSEPALDDPYLVLYSGQGIPADPLTCLAANDDIPDSINITDSEITGVSVPPGGAITMVGTTVEYNPSAGKGTGYYILVVTVE